MTTATQQQHAEPEWPRNAFFAGNERARVALWRDSGMKLITRFSATVQLTVAEIIESRSGEVGLTLFRCAAYDTHVVICADVPAARRLAAELLGDRRILVTRWDGR